MKVHQEHHTDIKNEPAQKTIDFRVKYKTEVSFILFRNVDTLPLKGTVLMGIW